MANIYIRSFPTASFKNLKDRARRNRRSVTQEAARILEEALEEQTRVQRVWEQIDLIRKRLLRQYGSFSDSTLLIREDRDR